MEKRGWVGRCTEGMERVLRSGPWVPPTTHSLPSCLLLTSHYAHRVTILALPRPLPTSWHLWLHLNAVPSPPIGFRCCTVHCGHLHKAHQRACATALEHGQRLNFLRRTISCPSPPPASLDISRSTKHKNSSHSSTTMSGVDEEKTLAFAILEHLQGSVAGEGVEEALATLR